MATMTIPSPAAVAQATTDRKVRHEKAEKAVRSLTARLRSTDNPAVRRVLAAQLAAARRQLNAA